MMAMSEELRHYGKLLVTPETAFKVETEAKVWDILRNVDNYKDLKTIFTHTAGRYSERMGYFVFNAETLYNSVTKKSAITDVNGENVGARGVFNDDAVETIFPMIVPVLRPRASESDANIAASMGMMSSTSSTSAIEASTTTVEKTSEQSADAMRL